MERGTNVSVIIVSWRVKDLLRRCLASIKEQTKTCSYEIFVVDNASGDGTAEMVRDEFPEAQLVANEQNLGFAKANNQAISRARGDVILLLNPDTELREDAIGKTFDFMRHKPEIGICGCAIVNSDGSPQPSVRNFPSWWAMAYLLLKLHVIAPWFPPLRKYLAVNHDYSQSSEVDQVMGAFFCIRGRMIDVIGPLDERFFIWFEEVDYCQRAKAVSWQVWYYADTAVTHHSGQSFKQALTLKKQLMFNSSLLKYFRKHHSFVGTVLLATLYPVSLLLALISQYVRR
ncbi:MAG: glycosyltransferase family 2 protein [bacterium]|nr:glycosyltransferase family 2 protein [bacterium]